ncbi:MAG: hypothetical protein LBG28_15135 [Tannerella sp.]|jgi:hypothetical protein|nr:hypothetical protein [Tannerella sp.]
MDGVCNYKDVYKELIERLSVDYGMDEFEAVQYLYHSEVYAKLSDIDTKIYMYLWTKLYKFLIDEINKKHI